jgi:hypothetical protein
LWRKESPLSLSYLVFIKIGCVFAVTVVERGRGDAGLQPRLSDIFGTPKCLRGDPSDISRFFLAYFVLIGTYEIV